MRFISAQPANLYYAWQVEVMLNNFLEMGINLNQVDIVCHSNNPPKEWRSLADNYAARFFFYPDTRETKNYISSIRPNILKQHFKAYPELQNEPVFYHDCDIVFSRQIDWSKYEQDDVCYGSDTKWYIAYDYIIGKGKEVFDKMVEIIDIDPQLIIDNNDNSIGAQYILKNIDADFWETVERDSERLFKQISDLNAEKKKVDPKYHELQIWCADMWAVLWNVWKRGQKTICSDELLFSWGTSTEEDYNRYAIMHNAGVTGDKSGLFYKAKYMNQLPYKLNLRIKPNTSSKKYYEWVQKAESKSVLL